MAGGMSLFSPRLGFRPRNPVCFGVAWRFQLGLGYLDAVPFTEWWQSWHHYFLSFSAPSSARCVPLQFLFGAGSERSPGLGTVARGIPICIKSGDKGGVCCVSPRSRDMRSTMGGLSYLALA